MLICEAVEPDGKTCRACEQYKRLDEYTPSARGKYGRASHCNACRPAQRQAWIAANKPSIAASYRKYRLRANYDLTPNQWQAMWDAQKGLCASCEDALRRGVGGAATDHIHGTKIVRALLCAPCNISFGQMKEDPIRIQKLANYAKAHSV